jgi:DNA-directed RNA polymerase specialized sigma24 family protein
MRKNLPKGEGNEEMIRMKLQGMTYREIGEIFGLTPEAVYRRVKRFKEVMSRGKG